MSTPPRKSLRKLFVGAQLAALAGTVVDFAIFILLHNVLQVWYMTALVISAIAGAVTNFLLGRYWVFESTEHKIHHQAFRYVLVSAGSLGLNALGVYAFTEFIHFPPLVSKVIVAIIVAISYNFLLQKNFVYRR